jgi:hypothetical protein
MAHAIPLPPTHPRKNLKGFADMREGHYEHACSSPSWSTDQGRLSLTHITVETGKYAVPSSAKMASRFIGFSLQARLNFTAKCKLSRVHGW